MVGPKRFADGPRAFARFQSPTSLSALMVGQFELPSHLHAAGSGGLGEIKPWHLHDIRRTVATNLARMKVPPQVTEAILNHRGSRGGVAGIYTVYSYDAEKRQALRKWAKHVERLVR